MGELNQQWPLTHGAEGGALITHIATSECQGAFIPMNRVFNTVLLNSVGRKTRARIVVDLLLEVAVIGALPDQFFFVVPILLMGFQCRNDSPSFQVCQGRRGRFGAGTF